MEQTEVTPFDQMLAFCGQVILLRDTSTDLTAHHGLPLDQKKCFFHDARRI
jgi:hypothetical protein